MQPNNQQPAGPPPQMPTTPYQSPVPEPVFPDQSGLSEHYKKPRKPWILPLLAVIFAVIVCGGTWFGYQAYRNNPATLFNQAIGASLHTKQVTETFNSTTSAGAVAFDVNDVKKPRLSTLTTMNLGVSTYVKGYGTMQNTYLSYSNNPNGETTTPPNLLDKWIQVRADGNLPSGATLNPLLTTIDPRYELLSPWVFGNFTSKDRKSIAGLARSTKLYRIDGKKVKDDKLGGRAVKVYDITVNNGALNSYFTKVGQAFGISSTDSSAAAKLYGSRISLKMYIQKDTHQVLRIDMTNDGVTSTNTYTYKADVPSEPNPGLSYDGFLTQIGS
jgi:hypothetical protein